VKCRALGGLFLGSTGSKGERMSKADGATSTVSPPLCMRTYRQSGVGRRVRRRGGAAGEVQYRLERVERAGADVAEHDPSDANARALQCCRNVSRYVRASIHRRRGERRLRPEFLESSSRIEGLVHSKQQDLPYLFRPSAVRCCVAAVWAAHHAQTPNALTNNLVLVQRDREHAGRSMIPGRGRRGIEAG
jgi:hypothetical protein